MRFCYYCKIEKDEASFTASQCGFHGGRKVGRCRECKSAQGREWRANNQHRSHEQNKKRRASVERKEYDRLRSYPRRYGITREQYEQKRIDQGFKCYICNRNEDDGKVSRWGKLCLDHDHRDGYVRSLLCSNCNKGLGCFQDDPEMLNLAANYLNYHNKMKGKLNEK